jgi:hypothetical protein
MKQVRSRSLFNLCKSSAQKKYLFPLFGGLLFIVFFVIISMRYVAQARKLDDETIAENITALSSIFKNIHESCVIVDFVHDKNYIDFLNVITFEGNRVGSMDLEYPAKWKGPYVHQPLVSSGKEYQVVRTNKGYFVIPGDGVTLSNGKTIGKDIIITTKTDIAALAREPDALLSQNRPLAARIDTASDRQIIMQETFLDNTSDIED